MSSACQSPANRPPQALGASPALSAPYMDLDDRGAAVHYVALPTWEHNTAGYLKRRGRLTSAIFFPIQSRLDRLSRGDLGKTNQPLTASEEQPNPRSAAGNTSPVIRPARRPRRR